MSTMGRDADAKSNASKADRSGWRAKLLFTETKPPRPKPLLANALVALRDAPEWAGVLAFDEFALVTMAMLPPPWLQRLNDEWTPRPWTDTDDVLATEWLQRNEICVQDVGRAAETVAREAAFHPIRDYLGGLRWDGTKRVEQFAETYLGARVTTYHRAVSRSLLISAVSRVFEPGCKADHVPVLEGPQGGGKSTSIGVLFSPWFSDDLGEFGTKDAAMQVRAAWGVEISELAAMTRGEIEKVKAFISRSTDVFRPPFGKRVVSVPRQSIFIGSTNSDKYIRDETGGRRFWPIACGSIDIGALERDRDQLWAETVQLYYAGVQWWLNDAETVHATAEQEARRVEDAWEQVIEAGTDGKDVTTVGDILEHTLLIDKPKWSQADQNRVGRCLVALGWQRGTRRHPVTGQKERCYRRRSDDAPF